MPNVQPDPYENIFGRPVKIHPPSDHRPEIPASKSNKDTSDAVDAFRFAVHQFTEPDNVIADKLASEISYDEAFMSFANLLHLITDSVVPTPEPKQTKCKPGTHKWGPWKLLNPGVYRSTGPAYGRFNVQSSQCTECSTIRVRKHRVYRPFVKEFSTSLPRVDRWWLRIPASILIFPLHLSVHLLISTLACIVTTIQNCRGIDMSDK